MIYKYVLVSLFSFRLSFSPFSTKKKKANTQKKKKSLMSRQGREKKNNPKNPIGMQMNARFFWDPFLLPKDFPPLKKKCTKTK